MSLSPGTRLGPYEVTALIGQGGMGEVSGSTGTWVDRTVAIRVRASGTLWAVCCGLVAAALLTGTVRAQRSPIEVVRSVPRQTIGAVGAQLGPPGRATAAEPASQAPAPAPPVPTQAAVPEEVSLLAYEGPPPPSLPETIARDADGRVTVRAVRVSEPLSIDGVLDERVYRDVLPAGGFIQTEPLAGTLATEQTDVWILFDDDNLYISARCWDSAPESEWVANEMRRDNSGIFRNDNFGILLDTFYDRRNGLIFNINPISGRMDAQMFDERSANLDWNPIWETWAGRFEGGWTVEMAVPFKSMRYRPGRAQVWGLQVHRGVPRLNEHSYLAPLPAAQGQRGLFMSSLAAAVVGLEVPDGGRTLEIKPYAIADLTSDRARDISDDPGGDLGLDVKYGVTQGLVADLTVNTDFAQVEADEQQVNLTRFSLFFPEKREFFLENAGTYGFGGTATSGRFAGGSDTPILFYSRQIGLTDGREVPIRAGGRLTGRVGRFSVGVLNVQAGDSPEAGAVATNFSVVRVRRDLLRRSSIGALFTGRSVSTTGAGSAETYGVDGLFSFFDNLDINTYLAKTTTPGLRADDLSYRGQLDYSGDRYGVQLEHLVVGDNFNPEVGFVRRDDFERTFGTFRFSPRPQSIALIRKLTWEGSVDYITDRAGMLETRDAQGRFGIEFENSDQFNVTYNRSYEFLERPFRIATGVTIPVGGYGFQDVQTAFTFGQQRRLSGRVSVQHGSFFSGDKTTVGVNQGRLQLTPQFSLEPSYSYNRVDLPEGLFTTHLVRTRTTYTMTPLMFVSALVQYNSSSRSLSTNLRLRWEYSPGSELFVVYNEDRDTASLMPDRFSELLNRAFVVKLNRLFRF